ncbi:hypothetical protein M9H77_12437 [Catharanthus roseus]|uniref:Uncharacterized protein n=1 Tax=Catharanthus roseus TaxID=4058 RepID=A0ACC0BHK1_CATRO|nr:hypothetical protein M9H77_12437 [Catharanthus roseus]
MDGVQHYGFGHRVDNAQQSCFIFKDNAQPLCVILKSCVIFKDNAWLLCVILEDDAQQFTVNNDDDEVDGSDGDDVVSSQSESNDDNDPKEGEFQTPQNPVNLVNSITENLVSARYEYTHSGAFLDMGSGSRIDDLVESGTVRLLDWNDSMTDIQLGMRFIDKVQAISAVRKYSISMGREYQVLKSKIDTWTARCYHHSDDNYCS